MAKQDKHDAVAEVFTGQRLRLTFGKEPPPMLWIQKHENGRRLYFRDWRIHHGLTGACLTIVGVALMIHDWTDRHLWMRGRDG